MSSAAEILVIILAVALAIFIILGIVVAIMLIKLTRQISEATENIAHASEGIDKIVQNVVAITSPIIIGKTVANIFKKINKKGKK